MWAPSSLLGSVLSYWFSREFLVGRASFLGQFWQDRFGEGGRFSFQADETEEGEPGPAWLVDVLCRSVGVPLAEARAVGVGALCRGLVEEAAAASLSVADRDCLNDEDQTWLLVHVPVLSGPEGTWVGCLGGCCSSGWGRSPAETCDPGACWEGWAPRGDPSGTTTGAEDLTGHSVRDWERRVVGGPGFLSGYSTAVADALDPNGEEMIVEHKCLAVDPGAPLLVSGTGGLPAGPELEREDLRPARSCEPLLVAWGTWGADRRGAWFG